MLKCRAYHDAAVEDPQHDGQLEVLEGPAGVQQVLRGEQLEAARTVDAAVDVGEGHGRALGLLQRPQHRVRHLTRRDYTTIIDAVTSVFEH